MVVCVDNRLRLIETHSTESNETDIKTICFLPGRCGCRGIDVVQDVLPGASSEERGTEKERNEMKSAKWWMGWLAAGIAALATGTACGAEETGFQFRGGHPWLSRDRAIVAPNGGGEEGDVDAIAPQAKGNQRAVSSGNIHELSGAEGRCFDITIAMYKQRDEDERRKIGLIITNFARGIYEMTEGRHFLGKVFVIENPGHLEADILWHSQNKGATTYFNHSGRSEYIKMYDKFLNDADCGGGTLTHEWGHYEYGFMDEYAADKDGVISNPHKNDVAVKGAIMAGGGLKNPRFNERCNLSYAVDENADDNNQGMWRSTRQTAQYRVFGQSCLEQLHDPVEPRSYSWFMGSLFWVGTDVTVWPKFSFRIPKWPEFSGINPSNAPSIDLDKPGGESKAIQYLEIYWGDTQKPMVCICLDCSGSMSEEQLENAEANTCRVIDTLQDGAKVEVLAFDSSVYTIVPFTELTAGNRAGLKGKLASLRPGGTTALWDAAKKGVDDMHSVDPDGKYMKSVLLMTDGGDNASSASRSSVVQQCLAQGVAFNSISYGNNADTHLSSASSATGGKNLLSSESLSSLSSAFSRLGTHGTDRGAVVDSAGKVGSSRTWEETFTVDSTATNLQATVTLSVPATNATVVLVSPSGAQYSAYSKVDVGSESSWVFKRAKPASGMWKVVVTAPSGTAVSCFVDTSAVAEPPQLMVWVDETNMVAWAAVNYGAPVDGARVRAVMDDNGTGKEVAFTGIGAGTYVLALSDCGTIPNGFTVRADAEQGVATYTYVGVMGSGTYDEGAPIPESFTRSEWVALGKENAVTLYTSGKGKLEFQWRTSGDGVPGRIDFLCNGNTNAPLGAGQGWTNKIVLIEEEGRHAFQWVTPTETRKFRGAWLQDVIWHPEPDVVMGPIEVTPRWPWNGLVDIDFAFSPTVEGTKASFSVSGVDEDIGTVVEAKTLTGVYSNLTGGTYRVTWDLGMDAPGFHSSAFTVKLDATIDPLPAPVVSIGNSTAWSGNQLEWNGMEAAETYSVFRGTNASGEGAVAVGTVVPGAGEKVSFRDSTAPFGQTVWYSVEASAWKLDGERSAWVAASRPMLAPTNVAATSGTRTDGVRVTWAPSAGSVKSRIYRGQRRMSSTGNGGLVLYSIDFAGESPIGETTGSAWLDTTAVVGTDYVYGVSAVSAEGTESSLSEAYQASAGRGAAMNTANGWRNASAPAVTSATRTNSAFSSTSSSGGLIWGPSQGSSGYGYSGQVSSSWYSTSVFKLAWEPVEGASAYEITHWPLTSPTNTETMSTAECSFSVAIEWCSGTKKEYGPGRKFRIAPVLGSHRGNSTAVEIP